MAKTEAPPVMTAPSPELTERRYVYNGQPGAEHHDLASRGNRPVKRRKQSPFNMIAVVVTVSFLIVFYVWNKITVNQLVWEVSDLQGQYQKIQASNEILRAEINKKSTYERIAKAAMEQMSMIAPKEQPHLFEVDQELLGRVAEE
jgi:cell division protein FtsL